jgi:hypothetical protein
MSFPAGGGLEEFHGSPHGSPKNLAWEIHWCMGDPLVHGRSIITHECDCKQHCIFKTFILPSIHSAHIIFHRTYGHVKQQPACDLICQTFSWYQEMNAFMSEPLKLATAHRC